MMRRMNRTLRLSLLVVVAVLIATAAKLTVEKVASDKLAAARKIAEGRVSLDNQTVDKLAVALAADKQAVDKLAKEVVPTRQEMFVTGPIHSGDTFAGMVGNNGFVGGPFKIRTDRKSVV